MKQSKIEGDMAQTKWERDERQRGRKEIWENRKHETVHTSARTPASTVRAFLKQEDEKKKTGATGAARQARS